MSSPDGGGGTHKQTKKTHMGCRQNGPPCTSNRCPWIVTVFYVILKKLSCFQRQLGYSPSSAQVNMGRMVIKAETNSQKLATPQLQLPENSAHTSSSVSTGMAMEWSDSKFPSTQLANTGDKAQCKHVRLYVWWDSARCNYRRFGGCHSADPFSPSSQQTPINSK